MTPRPSRKALLHRPVPLRLAFSSTVSFTGERTIATSEMLPIGNIPRVAYPQVRVQCYEALWVLV